MSTENLTNWNMYIETPRRGGAAMKLDRILKRRMKAFMKARQSPLSL